MKIKEKEKRDKYLDLAGEQLKQWNMRVMVIPIVIGKFETVPKSLERELEELEISGQIETNQSTTLLKSARILRRVEETCYHSDSSERPSAKAGVKNSQEGKEKGKEEWNNTDKCLIFLWYF